MIGKLVEFTKTTVRGLKANLVKMNLGGGHTKEGQNFAPAGDDSQPLPGDYVVCVPTAQKGIPVVVGYADPQAPQTAEPGDKIIYGRDSSGALVNRFWLKNTGEIVVNNASGTLTIDSAGSGTLDLTDLTINCDTTINGNLIHLGNYTLTGNYASTGTMFNNTKNVGDTHGHAQNNDSAGDTQQPIAGVT